MANRASSKEGESKKSFDVLADENTIDIFSRLPVKTLVLSTSVSKTWYSLINNPDFVSSQISRSISSCNKDAIFVVPADISNQKYCSLISSDTGFVFDNYEIPFDTKSGTLKLVGSINGLLCLTDQDIQYHYRDLYLWNPSVRKYRSLDSSCLLFNWDESYYVVGMGFNKLTNDYRVVRVVYCADDEAKLPPKAEIFSLSLNKWREIPNPIVPRCATETGTTINGKVYWIDTKILDADFKEVWILSFDFDNEVFDQVKLPDQVCFCLGETAFVHLMEFEGSVSVCVFKVDGSNGMVSEPCCIWMMREEEGTISWTERYRVVLKELGWPLNFTKSGTLLMVSLPQQGPSNSILSYNLETMQCKNLGFDYPLESELYLYATIDTSFVESLIMHTGGDKPLKPTN